MRVILILAISVTVSLSAFSQQYQTGKNSAFSYAYVTVEGKAFSKKLKVEVDFGDTPKRIQAGKDYSNSLTNKKSYAAVLNYMFERQFELVGTFALGSFYQGTDGTSGTVFVLKKRK